MSAYLRDRVLAVLYRHRRGHARGRDLDVATTGCGMGTSLPRSLKLAVLAVLLMFSAVLTAEVLRSPTRYWLAWISFLPLFVAVRWLRPAMAAAAGGLWGACLSLFFAGGGSMADGAPASAVGWSTWGFASLVVIPAVYVGLAARLTRSDAGRAPARRMIVLSTVLLTFGWTLVEAVFHLRRLFGPRDGLVTGLPDQAAHVHWLACLLGYMCTAFVVAGMNASLVSILSRGHRWFVFQRCFLEALRARVHHLPRMAPCLRRWLLRQMQPRAPPIA